MIRPAKFGDIPRLVALMKEAAAKSKYAGACEVDEREAKALLLNSIRRHGVKREGGTLVLVAERGETVEGFVIGVLQRVYHVGDKLQATDLFLYLSKRADGQDFFRMKTALDEWAESVPDVVSIEQGTTNLLGDGIWKRIARLYQRFAMSPSGAIYERRIAR